MKFDRFLQLYLFLFAFLIRLPFLVVTYPGNEQIQYHEDVKIAINLLEGKGYAYHFTRMKPNFDKQIANLMRQPGSDFTRIGPNFQTRPTAAKPPAYPLLVAFVFALFGIKNFFALFVIHALLAAFTCSLLFLSIARFSYSSAIIVGLVFALYPPFIFHSVNTPEPTTLIMFLISILCYELVRLHEHFTQIMWILASITCGILVLTEPVTTPFIIFSFLYVAYTTFSAWRQIFAQIILGALILTIVITPWTVRNYLVFKQLFFIKSNLGASLKESLYDSGIQLSEGVTQDLLQQIEGMDEISEDRAVKRAILSWIADNPGIYLRLLLKNFNHFWWETENYKMDFTVKYIFGRKLPYILLLVCSIPAMLWRLFQLAKCPRLSAKIGIYQNMMLILIFTYTVIYTLVGAVLMRYHFPVELGMFVFCAETMLYTINRGSYTHRDSLLSLKADL